MVCRNILLTDAQFNAGTAGERLYTEILSALTDAGFNILYENITDGDIVFIKGGIPFIPLNFPNDNTPVYLFRFGINCVNGLNVYLGYTSSSIADDVVIDLHTTGEFMANFGRKSYETIPSAVTVYFDVPVKFVCNGETGRWWLSNKFIYAYNAEVVIDSYKVLLAYTEARYPADQTDYIAIRHGMITIYQDGIVAVDMPYIVDMDGFQQAAPTMRLFSMFGIIESAFGNGGATTVPKMMSPVFAMYPPNSVAAYHGQVEGLSVMTSAGVADGFAELSDKLITLKNPLTEYSLGSAVWVLESLPLASFSDV
jgi:hypothetical protein